ncbi:MAG TPA: hypothetical protein VEO01_19670 [Pseudonocardiaceae bacterium]|nr:hypothetical protein [Pseudonocardiaceae bacterium]
MTRELLLATAVLLAAAGCASADHPAPPTSTTTTTGSAVAGTPPAPGAPSPTSPTGITSQDAARVAPLAPAQLTATPDHGGVRLAWSATGEDVAYYQCLRRAGATGTWEPIGRTATPGEVTYLDRNPGSGTHIYGIQAVNTYGTASPITESQPVVVG